MKEDNNGLYYYDERSKGEELPFSRPKDCNVKSAFYTLLDNPNYIIKKSLVEFDHEKTLKMLYRFKELKDIITKTDLPIDYYMEDCKMMGMVVPYYHDAPTLYTISKTKDLDKLMEVYKRDDDKIHNLFILYSEIIDICEELYDNKVCYYDSNSTNFVFKDNDVHLIDFDPKYVVFNTRKRSTIQTLCGIDDLADRMNGRFLSFDEFIYFPNSFKGLRKHLVKIENKVRKRR